MNGMDDMIKAIIESNRTLRGDNDRLRAELATIDRERVDAMIGLAEADARLAAVIALCDSDEYGDQGSMFNHDVRAAAVGEPDA